MFRRSSTRYGETPVAETPYQRAQQAWDERIGAARVQARNWRLAAFGGLALALVSTCGLIWQSARGTVTPWVVEVDKLGEVQTVAPAAAGYRPTDAEIEAAVGRFIKDVRSLSIDPIVVRDNWLRAYEFVTDKGHLALDEYARTNNPFAKIGTNQVSVEISSVVRASPNSFQVAWVEKRYEDSNLVATERWTAILTVVIETPHKAETLLKNPLGVYVHAFNWSKEFEPKS
jgi:type IV secretory pathway TrbF-like protein